MRYRRLYTRGGCYFFTVVLADRKRTLLIDRIDKLKAAFHKVKISHPFKINAIVILPDHFHMIMTLPEDDRAFSQRLNLIKGNFTRGLEKDEHISKSRQLRRERGICSDDFGSTLFAMKVISSHI